MWETLLIIWHTEESVESLTYRGVSDLEILLASWHTEESDLVIAKSLTYRGVSDFFHIKMLIEE
jgi:hypothetical protein